MTKKRPTKTQDLRSTSKEVTDPTPPSLSGPASVAEAAEKQSAPSPKVARTQRSTKTTRKQSKPTSAGLDDEALADMLRATVSMLMERGLAMVTIAGKVDVETKEFVPTKLRVNLSLDKWTKDMELK